MRLLFQNGHIVAQFNVIWEISLLMDLSTKGIDWTSVYMEGKGEPIGRIHTTTHEVQIFAGNDIKHRQVVVLGPNSPTSSSHD
ncbi:hypothetical protein KSD_17050 [Ktedonobacter sp. SOSP1-85]|nr:hypothetical protein KSD_17050 [Ktedonobacter sp. SOSP1-85]